MVEDLLDKLNKLEANFTAVDETVPLISSATRVSQIIQIYVTMCKHTYVHTYTV